MTLNELNSGTSHLLLKCISGSHAYGLALPQSDIDIKGVFVLPMKDFYGFDPATQVNDESNDIMFYELGRFFDLLLKNNPNILELLSTPDECRLYWHPLMDTIRIEMFLSRLCAQTFGQYAYAQIKKARGLNKKIMNPLDKRRKTILDFCYVIQGHHSLPMTHWLTANQFEQRDCGLVGINHMKDLYAIFHSSQTTGLTAFHGIYSGDEANDVSLTSVPDGIDPVAIMSFNKEGYSRYCKDYKLYWEWVDLRNPERYENTVSHGKNYDAKNMMHVFRLLNMAEEIARTKKVIVRRPEREFLLKIRAGEFEYEDLVERAESKTRIIDELFKKSDLPERPEAAAIEPTLVNVRQKFYTPSA